MLHNFYAWKEFIKIHVLELRASYLKLHWKCLVKIINRISDDDKKNEKIANAPEKKTTGTYRNKNTKLKEI